MLAPGSITSQAYDEQVRVNNAIEKELIGIANLRPCACVGQGQALADVYASSANK